MKVATPHWLPDGDSSSAGIRVSEAATQKACSVGVSVNNGSGAASVASPCAVGSVDWASPRPDWEKLVAAAVPANLRRGIVSSLMKPTLARRRIAFPKVRGRADLRLIIV
jgi:hypothetical protein